MTFQLDQVVPWGRSFDEYRRIFALSDDDLQRRILGCADGPAAFNCELSRRGGQVVSSDPLYAFGSAEIQARMDAVVEIVLEQTRQNFADFVWSAEIADVDALGRLRVHAMQTFLEDYPAGRSAGRYVNSSLPTLSFADQQFDLAVCSHFLFLYDRLGLDFHLGAVQELMRVADEVRIFPLLQLDGQVSPYLANVESALLRAGYAVDYVRVNYEFKRGAHTMLQIRRRRASSMLRG